MTKTKNKLRLGSKKLFYVLLLLLLVIIGGYTYFRMHIFLIEKEIKEQQVLLNKQNQELQDLKAMPGYDKLLALRYLEDTTKSMSWSDRILKIIEMLQDLKSVDTSSSETVVLSDFKVDLDTISVKGTVSNILLLYYTSPDKYISLLDRFAQLDFIENMSVQTYEKVAGKYFEFVLDANVVTDGTKK